MPLFFILCISSVNAMWPMCPRSVSVIILQRSPRLIQCSRRLNRADHNPQANYTRTIWFYTWRHNSNISKPWRQEGWWQKLWTWLQHAFISSICEILYLKSWWKINLMITKKNLFPPIFLILIQWYFHKFKLNFLKLWTGRPTPFALIPFLFIWVWLTTIWQLI